MLIDMSKVYRQTNLQNLEQAFSVAENSLGVTRLLDPEGETALAAPPPCLIGRANGVCLLCLSLYPISMHLARRCVFCIYCKAVFHLTVTPPQHLIALHTGLPCPGSKQHNVSQMPD